MDAPCHIAPFSIRIEEEVLADLRERIRRTRWPEPAPGAAWEQGTDLDVLRPLLAYWADGFDWRARERELNAFRQFRAELDGARIHFVHERAKRGNGIPLILTHGWPSTFAEFLPLVPLLTDPGAHGIDGPAFDVVIPSLPGYGFSERPARVGVNSRHVAGLWHRLMRDLGYERYGAQGGDFGAGVATFMALLEPERMLGLHLSNLDLTPYTGSGARPLSAAERIFLERNAAFWEGESGYKAIQSTKPQTLGYGLNDSPAGLAAWILEKWRSWADSGGDLERRVSRDVLLTTVTIYWVTQTITSSMRDYFDNGDRRFRVTLGPGDFVRVPTGVAVFAKNFLDEGTPPREWAERLYDVRRWSPMPRGGHFAAAEEPELLARDIAAFFAGRQAHTEAGEASELISVVDCDLCVTLPAYRKVPDLPLPDTWGRLATILVKGGWEGQDCWSPDPARYAAAVDIEEVRVCRRCGTHYLYCQSHDPHWGEPRPAETDWSLERVPLPRARAFVRRTGLDGAVESLDGGWLDRRYETLLELLRRNLHRAPDGPIANYMVDSLYGHYLGQGDWEGLRATLLDGLDPAVGVYVAYRIFAAIDPGGPTRHLSKGTFDDVGAMLRADPAREALLVAVLAEGLSAKGRSLEFSTGEPVAVSSTAMRTLRTYVPRHSLAPAVPALAAALRRPGSEHGGWRQGARDLLIEYVGAAPERASEVLATLAGDGDEVLAVRAHCQRCPAR